MQIRVQQHEGAGESVNCVWRSEGATIQKSSRMKINRLHTKAAWRSVWKWFIIVSVDWVSFELTLQWTHPLMEWLSGCSPSSVWRSVGGPSPSPESHRWGQTVWGTNWEKIHHRLNMICILVRLNDFILCLFGMICTSIQKCTKYIQAWAQEVQQVRGGS